MSYAFFSYSRADEAFAEKLATDLKANGVKLWYDQADLSPGYNWDEAIEKALKNCDTLIVIVSANSVKSKNVLDEISYALEENKHIIPIKISACEIPFRIRRLQYFDYTKDYKTSTEKLIKKLKPDSEEKIVEIKQPAIPLSKRFFKQWPYWTGTLLLIFIAFFIFFNYYSSSNSNPPGKIDPTIDTTGKDSEKKKNNLTDTVIDETKIDSVKSKKVITVKIIGAGGIFNCVVKVSSGGNLIESHTVNKTGSLKLNLKPGKYVFSLAGYSNSGSVTVEINGESVHSMPEGPYVFNQRMFLSNVLVDIN